MAAMGKNLTQSRKGADAVRTVPLGDVVKIDTSVSFPKASKIWLLNLDMIEQQTGRVIDYVFVEPNTIGGSTVGFDKECVLYSKLRPNLNKVVLPDRCGVATSEILPLRCSSDSVSREYICWYLRSPDFVLYAINRTAGAKMPRLGTKDLLKAIVPLPSLPEQKRIAATLDRICELKKNAETRLANLDLLVKSRFVEMFGDPMTNPKRWPITSIGDNISFLTSGSRGWAKYYAETGKAFITIKNVKNARIILDDVQRINPPEGAEAERTKVQQDDLLISITADLGRTGVVSKELADEGAYINQHLSCVRLDKKYVVPLFVAYFLESSAGKAQFDKKNQSAVKAGLNFDAIKSLRFYLPPLVLQREFAAFVEKVDKLALSVRKTVEQMDVLYRSKLQEYFG